MRDFRWQIAILLAIGVLGVGSALVISLRSPTTLSYEKEWVVALLQAGLIAVLGVVSSAVLESFKDGIQSRRDQSTLRFDALAELGRIFMDVKLIRRKAQATGVLAEAQLAELNERQVLLELQRDNSGQFDHGIELAQSLGTMEKYLNRVANKPDSDECRGFLNAQGFLTFSNEYRRSSSLMRGDIAPAARRPLRRAANS